MFLTLPPFKNFFKRNPFLTFLILNNFAQLKIILTIGLPPIYFKFITFNIIFFQKITLNENTKEQIQIHSLFLRKFFLFFKMPAKIFLNNLLPMNFYLSSILLITNIPTIIIFLIFLLLILYILPMTLIVLIKASIFLLLFVLISINTISLLRMTQFLQLLFKLSLPRHIL